MATEINYLKEKKKDLEIQLKEKELMLKKSEA
jgi:hypothetical protein